MRFQVWCISLYTFVHQVRECIKISLNLTVSNLDNTTKVAA